jgi:hypothetical protein
MQANVTLEIVKIDNPASALSFDLPKTADGVCANTVNRCSKRSTPQKKGHRTVPKYLEEKNPLIFHPVPSVHERLALKQNQHSKVVFKRVNQTIRQTDGSQLVVSVTV